MNDASSKLIGQQIDQYRVIEHIARGGMADVYLAEDVDLGRKVALKVMLDILATIDDQFSARFRREAQVVAQLDHPNIVHVYSVGNTPAGQPYIAMQYIEGGSLQSKLKELAERKKLLTTEQTLNIVRQIALALNAAHQAGIVHRDLKPANVLIRPDGAPVLVDLGIAAIQGGKKLTQTGSVIGTPAYMSPEQVRGGSLDGRSDLYALGVILYETLAGIPPFDADDSIAILHKQVYEDPLPLQSFRSDLSPQTLALVETALQKDPGNRYQSATEMVTAIDEAIRAEGLYGPNPQATAVLTRLSDHDLLTRSRIVKTSGRSQSTGAYGGAPAIPTPALPAGSPLPPWAIVGLTVLVTAIILFFAYRSFGPGRAAAGIDAAGASTTPTATITPAASEISPTRAPTTVNQPAAQATETPNPTEPAEDTPQAPPTNTPSATSPPIEPTATDVTVNADVIGGGSGLIAYSAQTDQSREIFTANLLTNDVRRITRDDFDDFVPVWSPNGRFIAYISGRNDQYDIFILEVGTGITRNLTNHPQDDGYPSWSPDGSRIVFHSNRYGDFDIFTINSDGTNLRQLTDNDVPDIAPEWSPDGSQISFTQSYNTRRQIALMNPDGSNQRLITSGENYSRAHPSWSADGDQLVFYMVPELSATSGLYIIDITGENLRQLTQETDFEPDWSPDGQWILFHRRSGNNRMIYRIRPDGTDLTLVVSSHPDVREAHWQP